MSGAHHGHGHAPAASRDNFAASMEAAMDRMMADMHAAPPTSNPDQDFLVMMIPHHQGAVDMAELVLRHGRDPLVRQMAEGMVSGQSVEIAAMRARLRAVSGGGPEEAFPLPGGTRGPA